MFSSHGTWIKKDGSWGQYRGWCQHLCALSEARTIQHTLSPPQYFIYGSPTRQCFVRLVSGPPILIQLYNCYVYSVEEAELLSLKQPLLGFSILIPSGLPRDVAMTYLSRKALRNLKPYAYKFVDEYGFSSSHQYIILTTPQVSCISIHTGLLLELVPYSLAADHRAEYRTLLISPFNTDGTDIQHRWPFLGSFQSCSMSSRCWFTIRCIVPTAMAQIAHRNGYISRAPYYLSWCMTFHVLIRRHRWALGLFMYQTFDGVDG